MPLPPEECRKDSGREPVVLSESPYEYLKLFCPFCGAPVTEGCRHRAFVCGHVFFDFLAPDFVRWMRKSLSIPEPEALSDTSAVPSRLRDRFLWNSRMAEAALESLEAEASPSGVSAVFRIESPARHDSRTAGFVSDRGLAVMKKALG